MKYRQYRGMEITKLLSPARRKALKLWRKAVLVRQVIGDVQPGRSHSRHHRGTSRRTDRGGGIGVGESHPLRRQSIQIRCIKPIIALAMQIHPTQVIGHDQHDVGTFA